MNVPATKEEVTSAKNNAITVYVTFVIALILWTSLLIRIVSAKAGFYVLILICVLMILYQFFNAALA